MRVVAPRELKTERGVSGEAQSSATEWPRAPLKQVCELNPRRATIIPVGDDDPVSFVPMPAVDGEHGVIAQRLERPFTEVKKGYTYFENGDVIFAKITPCMQNGKHAVCRDLLHGFGFGSTEFHVLRPGPRVLAEWVHGFLRQPELLHEATEHFSGTVGQQRLPEDYLGELEIPLPPLAEQNRIAARLAAELEIVERARAAAAQRLAAAEALPAALLREVFEGPKASECETRTLGELAPVQTGFAFKSEWFTPDGVRILRNANIHQGFLEWEDFVRVPESMTDRFAAFLLEVGDIVLTLDRPLVANGLKVACITPDDRPSLLNQRVARFRFDPAQLDADYLYAFLRSALFIDAIRGHDQSLGVPHISPAQVEAVEIPLPDLTTQRRLAAGLTHRLAAAEGMVARCREELAEIESLPAALLRAAFNGAS